MTGIQKFKLKPRAAHNGDAQATRVSPAQPSTCDADPIAAAMDQAAAEVPKLLTPKSVAEMLGLTERTLERWRITGEGPRFVKLSRSSVRYLADDIATFVTARLKANTAQ